MVSPTRPPSPRETGPAWDIARLYPDQGHWSEEEYLLLTDHTNRLVEFTDGYVEVLAMPTMEHQLIVQFLSNLMLAFVQARQLGRVLFAPLRVRLRSGEIREPDIVFMKREHRDRMDNRLWEGADLVVEVVSEDPESRRRDWIIKRHEYARAGIPEYWIVDPAENTVTVLRLEGTEYSVAGEYRAGDRAKSVLLAGFEVDVAQVWEVARTE